MADIHTQVENTQREERERGRDEDVNSRHPAGLWSVPQDEFGLMPPGMELHRVSFCLDWEVSLMLLPAHNQAMEREEVLMQEPMACSI